MTSLPQRRRSWTRSTTSFSGYIADNRSGSSFTVTNITGDPVAIAISVSREVTQEGSAPSTEVIRLARIEDTSGDLVALQSVTVDITQAAADETWSLIINGGEPVTAAGDASPSAVANLLQTAVTDLTVDYTAGSSSFTLSSSVATGFTLELAIQGADPTGVATFLVTPLQTTAVSLNKTTTTIANPDLAFTGATVSNSATREGELWTVVHNGDSGTATTDDTDPTIDEVIAGLTTPFSVTSVSVETNGGGTTAPQSSFAQRVTVITPVFSPVTGQELKEPVTWTVTLGGTTSAPIADVDSDVAMAEAIMDEINNNNSFSDYIADNKSGSSFTVINTTGGSVAISIVASRPIETTMKIRLSPQAYGLKAERQPPI